MALMRTPLYDAHVSAGGRMVPFAGWEMPVQYTGLMKEHGAVRTAAGLFDVSHMGEVRFRGDRAMEALQQLVTNDLAVLVDGQAQYNVVCNDNGGIVDDVVVYREAADDWMVCVNAANRSKDLAWFQSRNPIDSVQVVDEGDSWGQLAVQGRQAARIVGTLSGLDLSGVGTYHFLRGTVAGIGGCIIARTGYTGEDGFEVFVPAARAAELWAAVLETGGPLGLVPVGLGARDTLRLEARYCLYGHELDDETSPLQAGLGWVTKLGKDGGFIGRDALLRRKGNESHRLVGVVLDGKRIVREGMPVLVDGETVGKVTSGTRSPTLGSGICLAYVRRDMVRPGTVLSFDVRGRTASGKVVRGPFYRRDY